MNTTFNLLRYPVQAHQARLRWRVGSGLAGLLLGGAAAGAVLQWLQHDMQALAAEQAALQAQGTRWRDQAVSDKARQQTQARLQGQQALLAQVRQQQQAWQRLHQAVLAEAGQGAWVLERLQVDGDRLELQGRSRDVQALVRAQVRLSAQLPSPLALVSLEAPAADLSEAGERGAQQPGHVFVWQGTWPAMPVVARK